MYSVLSEGERCDVGTDEDDEDENDEGMHSMLWSF